MSLRRELEWKTTATAAGRAGQWKQGASVFSNLESIHREVQSQDLLPHAQEEQALCLVDVTVQLCKATATSAPSWHS